jgi:hypothetical protein
MVLCVSVACFVFSFVSYLIVKGSCIILTLIAGKRESRHLSTVMFVKDIGSCSDVTCYPDLVVLIADLVVQVNTWNTGDMLRIR